MIGTYSHVGWPKTEIACADYEEIVLSAVAQPLTAAKVALCMYVFIRFVGGPVRVTIHPNGVPTTSFGFRLFEGDNAVLTKDEAGKLRAILETADAGTLQAAYYKNV